MIYYSISCIIAQFQKYKNDSFSILFHVYLLFYMNNKNSEKILIKKEKKFRIIEFICFFITNKVLYFMNDMFRLKNNSCKNKKNVLF